ncbi:UPF0147 family protein [Candidatus Woesearchaeota archaeon]|nr:UPF0147 family protein [Candidatus Woesearchaeota archaeon]
MSEEQLKEVIDILIQIENDFSIPKNIRFKIKGAITALKEDNKSIGVKINKTLQELDSLDEESNMPSFTRTQIWNIVSSLESML